MEDTHACGVRIIVPNDEAYTPYSRGKAGEKSCRDGFFIGVLDGDARGQRRSGGLHMICMMPQAREGDDIGEIPRRVSRRSERLSVLACARPLGENEKNVGRTKVMQKPECTSCQLQVQLNVWIRMKVTG